MSGREATRGQPLKVFAVILGVWLIGRVLLWESPFPLHAGPPATAPKMTIGPLAMGRYEKGRSAAFAAAHGRE